MRPIPAGQRTSPPWRLMGGVSTRSQPSTSATIVLDPLIRVCNAGWVPWSASEEEESVCSALVCRHKFYGQFIYIIADWNCNSTPAPLTDPHPLSCPHTHGIHNCLFRECNKPHSPAPGAFAYITNSSELPIESNAGYRADMINKLNNESLIHSSISHPF